MPLHWDMHEPYIELQLLMQPGLPPHEDMHALRLELQLLPQPL